MDCGAAWGRWCLGIAVYMVYMEQSGVRVVSAWCSWCYGVVYT